MLPFVRRVCLVAGVLALTATSRPSAEAPRSFALTNVRIVPVSAPVIERGTVVVVDGLISAVGPSVAVPAGVWRLDGDGATVYPGLFDALSEVALPASASSTAAAPRAAGGGAQPPSAPVARGPGDRPASTPWEHAADALRPDDPRIETWRSGGFTTAMVAPRRGLLPGQGAVINLAGERAGEMVVRTPAAFLMTFDAGGGFRSFPGSLMGAISYLRQVHLDADHAAAAEEAYAQGARGRARPKYDRTVRAVHESRAARRLTLVPAVTAAQVARAVRLGREMQVSVGVYGAHEGYAAAPLLERADVPVLVSAKWPEPARDADPEADQPLRVLRLRDKAPSTPAALAAAGVRFAFYSDGLGGPADMLAGVRRAIEAGLSREAAVRALTLTPAEIFGIDDRLGSIEPGKIANLVVVRGDLLDKDATVTHVFVDGLVHEVKARAGQKGRDARPDRRPTRTTPAEGATEGGAR